MVPPLVDHLKYSFADQTSVLLAVLAELAHAVKEITALHELHDEVEALVLLEEVDERYDMRMVERGHDGDLLVGAGLLLGCEVLAKDDLDGDGGAGLLVRAATYRGVGALVELLVELVALLEGFAGVALRKGRELTAHDGPLQINRHGVENVLGLLELGITLVHVRSRHKHHVDHVKVARLVVFVVVVVVVVSIVVVVVVVVVLQARRGGGGGHHHLHAEAAQKGDAVRASGKQRGPSAANGLEGHVVDLTAEPKRRAHRVDDASQRLVGRHVASLVVRVA